MGPGRAIAEHKSHLKANYWLRQTATPLKHESHLSRVGLISVMTMSTLFSSWPAQNWSGFQLWPTPTPWTRGKALTMSTSSSTVEGRPTLTLPSHWW